MRSLLAMWKETHGRILHICFGGPEPRIGNLAPRACGCALRDSASSELFVRGREAAGSARLVWVPRTVRRPLNQRLPWDSGVAATSCGGNPPTAVGGSGAIGWSCRRRGPWSGPDFRNCSAIGSEAPPPKGLTQIVRVASPGGWSTFPPRPVA